MQSYIYTKAENKVNGSVDKVNAETDANVLTTNTLTMI